MASVRLVNLWKRYTKGNVDGVKGINLEVKDGEFVSFLGPSGCGKSSTLRMIAGLEEVTSGEIWIGERMVNDLPPQERNVAMVFENYALYNYMTVYENIAFPLLIRKVPKEEIKKVVNWVADILRITDILHEKPPNLSGGQKQRVSIGRAIVRAPDVLLMDEPISHVEARLRDHLRAELRRLHREMRRTVICVTHDQYEALTLAERIAVMNLGELQQYGTPQMIFERPANEFVAGFVGEPPMNFLDCELAQEQGAYWLFSEDFRISLEPLMHMIDFERITSPKLRLGVRPQDIAVYYGRKEENSVPGEVFYWETRGDENMLIVRVKNNICLAMVPPDFRVSKGDKVFLGFDVQKINLFDRATTKNVLKPLLSKHMKGL